MVTIYNQMNKITEKEMAKLKKDAEFIGLVPCCYLFYYMTLVTSMTCRYDCDIGPTEPSEQIVSFWTETC